MFLKIDVAVPPVIEIPLTTPEVLVVERVLMVLPEIVAEVGAADAIPITFPPVPVEERLLIVFEETVEVVPEEPILSPVMAA